MGPSPPPSPGALRPKFHDMEIHPPVSEDPSSSALWDWGDLLDFTVDDQFPISFDSVGTSTTIEVNQIETAPVPDRVRKRDPRLTCSNFLAGRVPCACPELDEKLEEEAVPGKKRVRTTRSSVGVARCQVPECEADIGELKGYHKRHRVCLRCANASAVVLDGENKRYCQQCGKFHLLSDFDEGKRSCRRKLERHNNRRRRKSHDSKGAVDKEPQGDLLREDTACDGEAGKDCQIVEKEALIESEDGNVSSLHSGPNSQNLNSDSGLSVGTPKVGVKDDSKFSHSPFNCDNKSFYSSVAGYRSSFMIGILQNSLEGFDTKYFKEFLHMPVELEGYIRPGCTILTAFLSMPTVMWAKLLEDPVSYVHDFVITPGKMLSKRSPMLVYLNNMIFHVMKDGNSVMKVNLEGQAPRLHYVHPTCFEAGKPIEFVACGSNLLQPKFRLLVSFAGKYLAYDYCVALPHGPTEGCSGLDHQLCKIFIPNVEPNVFGPAFIEIENESGLSNFIPVLIGNEEICSEMEIIQHRLDSSQLSSGSQCEVSARRQMAFSELVVDIAWLLKKPSTESLQQIMSSSQIQRLNSLLNFLLHHESTAILAKILQNLKIIVDEMEKTRVMYGISDFEMSLLQKYMDGASDILHQKVKQSDNVDERDFRRCSETDMPSVAPFTNEDLEKNSNEKLRVMANSSASDRTPLLSKEVVVNVNLGKERPNRSCSLVFSNRVMKFRPAVFLIATFAVCLGVCAILLHPNQVNKFAVSIRRCLTDRL
ncbi:squamosa promoter-binding-like protein 7 isoform X2 [Hevea brasiliensis]|uniref:squamosa promoter-binding-like protein 7 isoform X2 n=1 Tax=Hevea brasiliensis TaxID=3981 RepID=UPI0025FB1065|nr:squamosa promoter-binding-like protein 7 isoform X2 [Hevea brasiliensis]